MDQEEEDIEGMMEELASFYCSGMDDDDLRVFRDAIDSNRYVITINCSEFYEFPPLFQEKVTNELRRKCPGMTDSQVAAIVSIVQKQRREMSVADMMKHNMIAPIQDMTKDDIEDTATEDAKKS